MVPAGTISHFEILRQLGQGGMGTVYKARDLHLGRVVAIKVLSSESPDAEERARFVQEAKCASSLNHPHIVTVYAIDTAGDTTFIVMEYVDGHTLEDIVRRGGLTVRETLDYGIQVADALSAAHSVGIVHRDVKPGNILVTADGTVKVVDFGIAKLTRPPVAVRPEGKPSSTVTIAGPETEEGRIIGTVAYMSPEQAEGKKVDARSDVFSFGAVIYEMLTGRRAFPGDSKVSTLAAILNQEPEPLSTVSSIPPRLARIVTRTIRKDPSRRYQAMADLKFALEDVREDLQSGMYTAAVPERATSGKLVPILIAAVLTFSILAVAMLWSSNGKDRVTVRAVQFRRLTADSGLTTEPAISPDGKLIAYASDRSGRGDLDIWVQQIAGGSPVRLTNDEANERQPAFSPDGSQVVFRSERENGGIYVVAALGGQPIRISSAGFDPQFSPDGRRIAYWTGAQVTASTPSRIYVVPASGGVPEEIVTGLTFSRHPVWTPDGSRLLFWGAGPRYESLDWYTIEPDKKGAAVVRAHFELDSVSPQTMQPVYAHGWIGNRVLFALPAGDSTDLWFVPLDTRKWQVKGKPERLTSGLDAAMHSSVSGTGRVVWSRVLTNVNVWTAPLNPSSGRITRDWQPLTTGITPKWRPFLSRDGSRLVFNDGEKIVVKELRTGAETTLSQTGLHASLTSDGTKVVYARGRGGRSAVTSMETGVDMYIDQLNGDVPEKICTSCGLPPAGWSTDQKRILYDWGAPQAVFTFELATRTKITTLSQPGRGFSQASFSPDDKWLLFLASGGPGRQQVYVAPDGGDEGAPDESRWIPITDGVSLDTHPRWSADGKIIYFLSNRDGSRCLWARHVDESTKQPAGPAFDVSHFHAARESTANVQSVGLLGLGVSRDRLALNLGDSTGNIWMAELQAPGFAH